jgi:hypothetical protein
MRPPFDKQTPSLFFYAIFSFLFVSSVVAVPNPFAGYWALKRPDVSELLLYRVCERHTLVRMTTNSLARFYKLKQEENITFWNLMRDSR